MAFVSALHMCSPPRPRAQSSSPRRRPPSATVAHPATATPTTAPVVAPPAAGAHSSAAIVAPIPETQHQDGSTADQPVAIVNSDAEFLQVLQRSATQLVVLRVHARWCRSCRALEPKWRRLARELQDVHFAEMEYEANKMLAFRLSISKMPTFLIYDAQLGQVDNFTCGPKRAQLLREHIDAAYNARAIRLSNSLPNHTQAAAHNPAH